MEKYIIKKDEYINNVAQNRNIEICSLVESISISISDFEIKTKTDTKYLVLYDFYKKWSGLIEINKKGRCWKHPTSSIPTGRWWFSIVLLHAFQFHSKGKIVYSWTLFNSSIMIQIVSILVSISIILKDRNRKSTPVLGKYAFNLNTVCSQLVFYVALHRR